MQSEDDYSWMDAIREKLATTFNRDVESLVRILHFLCEEDKLCYDNPVQPYSPYWNSLKATLYMDKAFKKLAEQLSEDTKEAKKDAAFKMALRSLYDGMLEYSESEEPVERHQGWDVGRCDPTAFSGFSRVWALLPAESKQAIAQFCRNTFENRALVARGMNNAVGVFEKAGGAIVTVALTGVYLGYKVYTHIKRWWKGEIDGKWCAKHIIDDTAAVFAGGAGAFAGAAIGGLIGPWGSFIGGIIGGFGAGKAASVLVERLTQYIFGLPKSEALSNAYRYLGVNINAPNIEVNRAFRRLCLYHHPDKGGDRENFFILQCHMAVIRQARGEY